MVDSIGSEELDWKVATSVDGQHWCCVVDGFIVCLAVVGGASDGQESSGGRFVVEFVWGERHEFFFCFCENRICVIGRVPIRNASYHIVVNYCSNKT